MLTDDASPMCLVVALHILRNPYGWSADRVREARLWACDALEAATLASSSAAREDAERLDWLEANSWRIRWAKGYGDVPDTWFYESQAGTMIDATSLRAAIDAARSATKGEVAG